MVNPATERPGIAPGELFYNNIPFLKEQYVNFINDVRSTVEEKKAFFEQQAQFGHCSQILYDLMEENPAAFANITFFSSKARSKLSEFCACQHSESFARRYFLSLLFFALQRDPRIDNATFCLQSMKIIPEHCLNQFAECCSGPEEAFGLGVLVSVYNNKEFTETCLRSYLLINRPPGEVDGLLQGLQNGWSNRSPVPPGGEFIFSDDILGNWFMECFCPAFSIYSWNAKCLAYSSMDENKRLILRSFVQEIHGDDPPIMLEVMMLISDCPDSFEDKKGLLSEILASLDHKMFNRIFELLVAQSVDQNNRSKILPYLIVILPAERLEHLLKLGGTFARTNSFALLNISETRIITKELCSTPVKLHLLCRYLTSIIKSVHQDNHLDLMWPIVETAKYGATLPCQQPNPTPLDEHVIYRFTRSLPTLYLSLAGLLPVVNQEPIQAHFISFIPYLSEEQCRVFALSLKFTHMEEGIATLLKCCKTITLEKYLIILQNLSPDIVNALLAIYRSELEQRKKAGNLSDSEIRTIVGPFSLAILEFDKSLPEDNKPEDLEAVVTMINAFTSEFRAATVARLLNAQRNQPSIPFQTAASPQALSQILQTELTGISENDWKALGCQTLADIIALGFEGLEDFQALGISRNGQNNLGILKSYISQNKLRESMKILNEHGFHSLSQIIDAMIAERKDLFKLQEVVNKFSKVKSAQI